MYFGNLGGRGLKYIIFMEDFLKMWKVWKKIENVRKKLKFFVKERSWFCFG